MGRSSGGGGGSSSAAIGSWFSPSVLGSSKRAAVDILMSAYDTDPASTDQTVAFQNALTAAETKLASGVAAKVRIFLDSRQKYVIGGAVTAGANGQWAQIPLPFSQTVAGVIQLVGMPRGDDYSYIGMGESGTVIETTLGSAPAYQVARGIASIFGGPASFSSAHSSYNSFSFIKFATKDITIRSASPVIAGIDCGWVAGFEFEGLLQFDTDQTANIPGGKSFNFSLLNVCTAPQAIALITPFANDWYGTTGDVLVVSGWLHCVYLGEYVDIKRMVAFANGGAVLGVDGSKQISRIGLLTDWDNPYGIATFSPSSAVPTSPGATALGSGYTGLANATPIEIGTWNLQWANNALPAGFSRVADVMDANGTFQIIDADYLATLAGGAFQSPIIMGSGGLATGFSLGTRIRRRDTFAATFNQAAPGTGVSFRNPYGRDALVHVVPSGATLTVVTIDTVQVFNVSDFLVPSQGVVSVTYTGGPPIYQWQCI